MDISTLIIGLFFFFRILTFLIIARIIMSWVFPHAGNPVARFIFDTTEIILAPIRRMLPQGSGAFGMIDWSPLIALLLIDVIRYTLSSLLI